MILQYNPSNLKALRLAAEQFSRAIRQADQPVARHHTQRGIALFRIAQQTGEGHEQALAELNKAIELGANDAAIFMARSEMLEATGDLKQAAEDAELAYNQYSKAQKDADKKGLSPQVMLASSQRKRVNEKILVAAEEKIEQASKRFNDIAKDNPKVLEELNKAVEKARQKKQNQANPD